MHRRRFCLRCERWFRDAYQHVSRYPNSSCFGADLCERGRDGRPFGESQFQKFKEDRLAGPKVAFCVICKMWFVDIYKHMINKHPAGRRGEFSRSNPPVEKRRRKTADGGGGAAAPSGGRPEKVMYTRNKESRPVRKRDDPSMPPLPGFAPGNRADVAELFKAAGLVPGDFSTQCRRCLADATDLLDPTPRTRCECCQWRCGKIRALHIPLSLSHLPAFLRLVHFLLTSDIDASSLPRVVSLSPPTCRRMVFGVALIRAYSFLVDDVKFARHPDGAWPDVECDETLYKKSRIPPCPHTHPGRYELAQHGVMVASVQRGTRRVRLAFLPDRIVDASAPLTPMSKLELMELLPALFPLTRRSGQPVVEFYLHTDGLAAYRKTPVFLEGCVRHMYVNHSIKEWSSPLDIHLGPVTVRVKKGTQMADCFWRLQKRKIVHDRKSDEWGLMIKYMERAWAYSHAEDLLEAWRTAVARANRLGFQEEGEFLAEIKKMAIAKKVVVFQSTFPDDTPPQAAKAKAQGPRPGKARRPMPEAQSPARRAPSELASPQVDAAQGGQAVRRPRRGRPPGGAARGQTSSAATPTQLSQTAP